MERIEMSGKELERLGVLRQVLDGVVSADGRGLPLLRGLLFTTSGERLIPTLMVRKDRCYCYYTPAKERQHYGAGASNFGSLPGEAVEGLVVEQIC